MNEPPGMIEVRSSEGRLLCRVATDWSVIEIVQRRRRYTVARLTVGMMHAVVVAQASEEEAPDVDSERGE